MKMLLGLVTALLLVAVWVKPVWAAPESMTADEIVSLAQSGVGYSYYWGRGSWREDGAQPGSCAGSCPNCTHTGSYGADCSGYVAKVWQVPGPIALATNSHPYSTSHFRWQSIHWDHVDRGSTRRADAFVYRNAANSGGHIVLYESGDPWGSSWVYEARGCSYGIVHNLKSVSSSYVTIRRHNMNEGPQTGTLIGSVFVDRGDGDMDLRIPGASVQASGLSTAARAEDAIWSLELPPGQHQANASASGYLNNSRSCDVQAGQTTWCSIGLAEACTPACGGKACGPDGCGGSCGTCPADHACSADGQCACQANCQGLECGPDPVCGVDCGSCGADQSCQQGICQCLPDCSAQQCGTDPICGVSCGSCGPDQECQAGVCLDRICPQECGQRLCGPDPVCGADCGQCPGGQECTPAGACVEAGCAATCLDRACGPDPICLSSCGHCQVDRICDLGGMCQRIDPDRAKIYGLVTSGDTRLPTAEVWLDAGQEIKVDEEGYWELTVQPGEHVVLARASGYRPAQVSCEAEAGGYANCPIDLAPDDGSFDPDEVIIQGGCASVTPAGPPPIGFLILFGLALLNGLRRKP